MRLEPGRRLSLGDIVREVRRGGFSEVAITETKTGLRAMKRLRDDVLAAGGERVAQQFVAECTVWHNMLAAAPYVARALLPIDSLDDLGPVLFMEYVDGGSLRDLLMAQRQLSLTQTVRVGTQIARALAYAHARNIAHRDLKPNNVMWNRDNEVRLIDWGISAGLGAAGLEAFNPYCSPERMTDPSLVDDRDDVYMLGSMLFEALTGRLPHERAGRSQPVTYGSGSLPESLTALIAAMLDVVPGNRPGAAQVAETLTGLALVDEVQRREIESPFCPSCGFVSALARTNCPVCAVSMLRRRPGPVPARMVRIPAGAYHQGLTREQARQAAAVAGMMDLPDDQLEKVIDEPIRKAFVSAFDIDVFPVTNADFAAFCEACDYPVPDNLATHRQHAPDHPVTNVTWKDALCYALWVRKRLPTREEWEKAARGSDDARSYPWGNAWDASRCNHAGYTNVQSTSAVSHFTEGRLDGRSPYGVADMVGNVAEWVSSGNGFVKEQKGGNYGRRCAIYGLVSFHAYAPPDMADAGTGFRCSSDIQYDEVDVAGD
jgi:formylglycine-generating enzyme required for sulfatase activity